MATVWENPIYTLQSKTGKKVTVDVTASVSAGLPPNKVFASTLINFFQERGVEKIVDFGAGALRHTLPLLEAGFEVCAVEFEQQFKKPACKEKMLEAEEHPNFCKLIWPSDFKSDGRQFDAALLCYVLQTMPIENERHLVLKMLKKKLADDSYVLYMSRWGQKNGLPKNRWSSNTLLMGIRHIDRQRRSPLGAQQIILSCSSK